MATVGELSMLVDSTAVQMSLMAFTDPNLRIQHLRSVHMHMG